MHNQPSGRSVTDDQQPGPAITSHDSWAKEVEDTYPAEKMDGTARRDMQQWSERRRIPDHWTDKLVDSVRQENTLGRTKDARTDGRKSPVGPPSRSSRGGKDRTFFEREAVRHWFGNDSEEDESEDSSEGDESEFSTVDRRRRNKRKQKKIKERRKRKVENVARKARNMVTIGPISSQEINNCWENEGTYEDAKKEAIRRHLLDFHQFSATLSLVSSILNSRPLSVRTTPDGDFLAVSPKDVLLGRASRSQQSLEKGLEELQGFEDDQNLARVEDAQAKIISEWRRKWIAQVFPDLVPRSKWKQAERNLRVGDIGILKYEKSLGSDSWRLARIAKAAPDLDGLVRTITVQFRPRHVRDRGKKYRTKQPLEMDIGVQRFAVMLPVEEQESWSSLETVSGPAEEETVPQQASEKTLN